MRDEQLRPGAGAIDPLLGRVIDERYCIERLLGAGGMGRVYEGRHTKTGAKIAIKIIPVPAGGGRELRARSLNEARAAMKIQSNYVVRALDVGEVSPNLLYIVMEFLAGVSLEELLAREGPLPWLKAADIVVQICSGLTAAHRIGVLHRDIKPQNCLIVPMDDQEYQVKIIDFGIAREEGDAKAITQQGFLVGTPEYLAPELVQGVKANVKTDVYAVGVTLYKLLTNTLPFRGVDTLDTLEKIRHDALIPPSQRAPHLEIPPDADEIVCKALARDPQVRFPSPEEMARAIRSACNLKRSGLTPVSLFLPSDAKVPLNPAAARVPPGAKAHPPPGSAPAPVTASQPRARPESRTPEPRPSIPHALPPEQRGDLRAILLRAATLVSLSVIFALGTWFVSPADEFALPDPPAAASPPPETPTLGPPPEGAQEPPLEAPPESPQDPSPPPPAPPIPEPPVTVTIEQTPPVPAVPEENFDYVEAKKLIDDEIPYLQTECMKKVNPPLTKLRARLDVLPKGLPEISVYSSAKEVRACVRKALRFPLVKSPRGGAFIYTLEGGKGTLERKPLDPKYIKEAAP